MTQKKAHLHASVASRPAAKRARMKMSREPFEISKGGAGGSRFQKI
jgi:hypothetical protein